jgi:hypothetical protein
MGLQGCKSMRLMSLLLSIGCCKLKYSYIHAILL